MRIFWLIIDFNPFPYHFPSDGKFVQDTVPTPPRAATDRPRALGYMIWMRTIDTDTYCSPPAL